MCEEVAEPCPKCGALKNMGMGCTWACHSWSDYDGNFEQGPACEARVELRKEIHGELVTLLGLEEGWGWPDQEGTYSKIKVLIAQYAPTKPKEAFDT